MKRRNSDQIIDVIIQLSKYQTRNGGFVFQPNNTIPDTWLTSYIGEFMLTASRNGYKINEGILNKWKRYQQIELQRIKYSNQTNEINSAYLIYTLSLANSILIKQLNEFNNPTIISLIDRVFLANAYAKLGNERMAKSLINLENINVYINKLDIRECAYLLNLSNILKNNEASLKLKVQLNKLIENKGNSSHNIVIALNSILNTLNIVRPHSNIQLQYQINNGKENSFLATSPLSHIDIPLEFTLSKYIDILNTGENKLYINLSYIGNPQEYGTSSMTENDLQVTNQYFSLDNYQVDTKKSMLGDYIKQVISYKNLSNKLNQNLSVSIPIPSGVELIYSNIPNPSIGETANSETIHTQLLLSPMAAYEFVLVYKSKFRGEFISYPIITAKNNQFYNRTYANQSRIYIK